MKKITKKTTLAEIMDNPAAIEVLREYNLPCLGCPMAKFEVKYLKIGEVCENYGIDPGKLIEELNKSLKK